MLRARNEPLSALDRRLRSKREIRKTRIKERSDGGIDKKEKLEMMKETQWLTGSACLTPHTSFHTPIRGAGTVRAPANHYVVFGAVHSHRFGCFQLNFWIDKIQSLSLVSMFAAILQWLPSRFASWQTYR